MNLAPEPTSSPPAGDVSRLADHLFRSESGRMVSILTRIFGVDRLQLAEDVVQEALTRALQTWPFYGIPDNPAAWLLQTSRNLALDVLRREKRFCDKQPEIIRYLDQIAPSSDAADSVRLDSEIRDNRLRLMFACCHPAIPLADQAALALKTLCGFGVGEIARAFLTSEAAVSKRLTRARQRIREQRVPFEIPAGSDLPPRLDGVLQTIYLLFNEGYKASSGENVIREDLCQEAIRLASLVAEHPAGDEPRAHALLALMLLNAARLPSRIDGGGNILRLREQDRSCWDRAMIQRGMIQLALSARGDELTAYHVQAGIAALHCTADDYESTDWPRILALYDQLVELNDSPVVALNRAVAVAEVQGPDAGIEALDRVRDSRHLEDYYLFHAVLGELEARRGRYKVATESFREALHLAEVRSEQALLGERLRRCEEQANV